MAGGGKTGGNRDQFHQAAALSRGAPPGSWGSPAEGAGGSGCLVDGNQPAVGAQDTLNRVVIQSPVQSLPTPGFPAESVSAKSPLSPNAAPWSPVLPTEGQGPRDPDPFLGCLESAWDPEQAKATGDRSTCGVTMLQPRLALNIKAASERAGLPGVSVLAARRAARVLLPHAAGAPEQLHLHDLRAGRAGHVPRARR